MFSHDFFNWFPNNFNKKFYFLFCKFDWLCKFSCFESIEQTLFFSSFSFNFIQLPYILGFFSFYLILFLLFFSSRLMLLWFCRIFGNVILLHIESNSLFVYIIDNLSYDSSFYFYFILNSPFF